MPFESKLHNPFDKASAEGVSARLYASGGHGNIRLILAFTAGMTKRLPAHRADVQWGAGEDAGKAMLTFYSGGGFQLVKSGNRRMQARRLTLPVPNCAPAGMQTRAKPCVCDWRDQTCLVIGLPVDHWKSFGGARTGGKP